MSSTTWQKNNYPNVVFLLRRTLYLWLLWNTITLLLIANQVWGVDAHTIKVHANYWLDHLFLMLLFPEAGWLHWVFIVAQIAFILLGLSGRAQRISAIGAWYCTANLFYQSTELGNGGTVLIGLVLFFLMFANEHSDIRSSLSSFTGNLAVLAVKIQICVVYLTAGCYKFGGDLWASGEALYYTLSVPEYSHPWAVTLSDQDWLLVPTTYLVWSYQLLFPVVVWITKVKRYWLWLGIVIHLAISFLIGLVDFGLAMIAVYTVFIAEDRAATFVQRLPFILKRPTAA